MNHALSVLTVALAVMVVAMTVRFRRRTALLGFSHPRWVGLVSALSTLGFVFFMLSEVVELVLPIEALENSMISIILGILAVREVAALALFAKHGRGSAP